MSKPMLLSVEQIIDFANEHCLKWADTEISSKPALDEYIEALDDVWHYMEEAGYIDEHMCIDEPELSVAFQKCLFGMLVYPEFKGGLAKDKIAEIVPGHIRRTTLYDQTMNGMMILSQIVELDCPGPKPWYKTVEQSLGAANADKAPPQISEAIPA